MTLVVEMHRARQVVDRLRNPLGLSRSLPAVLGNPRFDGGLMLGQLLGHEQPHGHRVDTDDSKAQPAIIGHMRIANHNPAPLGGKHGTNEKNTNRLHESEMARRVAARPVGHRDEAEHRGGTRDRLRETG